MLCTKTVYQYKLCVCFFLYASLWFWSYMIGMEKVFLTGLVAILDKSNIFFQGWEIIDRLLYGYSAHQIPWIASIIKEVVQNQVLINKITQRITTSYSKILSYARRLQEINVILFSIYNFWGIVFILPQSILKEIDRKCREYLWRRKEDTGMIALVAWEKVCTPKKNRGLSVKRCKTWNIAIVGKLLWQVTCKELNGCTVCI